VNGHADGGRRCQRNGLAGAVGASADTGLL